jgi:putative ATP-dependent endonuclease of OLD family
LTDFDPKDAEVSQEDADPSDEGVGTSYGRNRVVNQIMREAMDPKEWDKLDFNKVLARSKNFGVFLNEFTFEVDLFKAGAEPEFAQAITALTSNAKMHSRFKKLAANPATLEPKQFIKDIDSVGKGRVAQRLASIFLERKSNVCPPYIKAALDYMKTKLT